MNDKPQENIIKKTALKIGGIHCAGCITAIQNHISDIQGVKTIQVNLAAEKASLEYDSSLVELDTIEKEISSIGYSVIFETYSINLKNTELIDSKNIINKLLDIDGIKELTVNEKDNKVAIRYNPTLLSRSDLRRIVNRIGIQIINEDDTTTSDENESKKLKTLFIIGIVFSIPVVIFGYPEFLWFVPYSGSDFAAYLIFACASIVQFAVGWRFYVGAYRSVKIKSANMDTLVVTGTTAAFMFSTLNTFPSPVWNNIYYDAAVIVITFIILGKYIEHKTKGKASSIIREMLELQPKTTTIVKNNQESEVPVETIEPGDIMVIKPGQKIPVDSIVLSGFSAVDESMITGESIPIEKKSGDALIGGTVNYDGSLVIRATKVGNDTVLSQIIHLVENAMGTKPSMQKLVDRVAGYFAVTVLIAAFATFWIWVFISPDVAGISVALIPAVAMLVVACPCALGLATPTAIMVGMGKGAKHGVIFKGGDALEILGKINIVVFDKTGTLTEGKPIVTDVIPIVCGSSKLNDTDVLKFASIAEKNSEHPLARSIIDKAKERNLNIEPPEEFLSIPGKGVRATHKGKPILVTSPNQIKREGISLDGIENKISNLQEDGKTVVVVSYDGMIIGIIALVDIPKQSAKRTLEELKRLHIDLVMLTGDNAKTANAISQKLSIEKVFADVLPSEKVNVIKQLQNEGNMVAMIGDGINDAAALTQANVGIAIGTGTDIAIDAGNIILLRNDLFGIITAIEVSKKTIRKIKHNLFYAFAYNTVLLPVAGMGLLYPALAGIAMASSSASVTLSSLALKLWNPKKRQK